MNKVLRAAPPGWFWLAALGLLAWNGLGVFFYLSSVLASGAQLAERYSEAELAVISAAPFWVTGAFAIAVFAGLAGAIGLLMKRGWARAMFVLSLIASLIQQFWSFVLSDWVAVAGTEGLWFSLLVDLLAIFGIWLAARGIHRGWLR